MQEMEKEEKTSQDDLRKDEDIFETQEVKIEEMAIDGICGVY